MKAGDFSMAFGFLAGTAAGSLASFAWKLQGMNVLGCVAAAGLAGALLGVVAGLVFDRRSKSK
ncbi:hypothetical protein ACE6ED_25295 [Paenibacillus sp. CN-4]|uniref:hypothetical protein n=1 Tax=Paenibacillus nanchangensis TaxID=3348343 RepID=UPI003978CBFA